MNATDQAKLCKAGYTILRRMDYPSPCRKFKSEANPHSWKRYVDYYPSNAERYRSRNRLLQINDIIED